MAGAALSLVACSGSSADLTAWNPDAQVGAGKSGGNVTGIPGAPTHQYVNYALFGNCLDVNGQNFGNKLIAYPCKQAPDTNDVDLEPDLALPDRVRASTASSTRTAQRVRAAASRQARASAVKDCLVSPGTLNGLVYGVQCPTGTPPDNELWNATGEVVGNYPNSYLLINKSDGHVHGARPVADLERLVADRRHVL